ncbi:probable Cyanate hydratase [Ustilago bromivora]|uniref:Cyanate hydratase n=1 Tax=Ustilago bromivora TaxID=307758 RepID=A0A1K0H288_9BASI|nr:probable Cyanate hydratase [Ustilago bromivora]SPC67295.1 probable Cyanate hydratase [Ustilago sp. UG-2017b]SYW77889.1 probable Cyanate hydratase [Ustilago bromivora]
MSNRWSSGIIQKPRDLSTLPPILSTLRPVFTALHEAKYRSKLSFADIASQVGRDEWYVAAIFYGQAKPDQDDVEKLSVALNLPQSFLEEQFREDCVPHRGLGDFPPQDPVLYRLYEVLVVYGYPLKHLIYEKFGDGIMSAIDFEGHVEKVKGKQGEDRVKITLDGKFLPYRRW